MTNTYSNRLRTALAPQQPTGKWTNGFGYDAAKRLTNSYNNRLRTALSLAQPTDKWTNSFGYDAVKSLTKPGASLAPDIQEKNR